MSDSSLTPPAVGLGGGPGHHAPAQEVPVPFGLIAQFPDADTLVAATRRAKAEGYTHLDTHTPYPVGEAADAIGFPKSEMGVVMFVGGLVGALGGFFMEYWMNAYSYPLIIGGRPFFKWPVYIPITFELMVLTASLSGLFGLIALCGLPHLNHPLFNSKAFDRATRDRFFLSVEADDPKYDSARTADFLRSLNPELVEEVFE